LAQAYGDTDIVSREGLVRHDMQSLKPRDKHPFEEDSLEPSVQSTSSSYHSTPEDKWARIADVGFRAFSRKNEGLFHELLCKGIPQCLRWRAWKDLAGVQTSCSYQNMLKLSTSSVWKQQIDMDVQRTLASGEVFCAEKRQQLVRVLNAYAVHNHELGYCQGMNYIAAVLLMASGSEEETFYMFKFLMEDARYGLAGFFKAGFPLYVRYRRGFELILEETAPEVHQHLRGEGVAPDLYLQQWLLTMFANTLPLPAVLHLWDLVICEGLPFVLKMACCIVKFLKDSLLNMQFEEIIAYLKRLDSPEGESRVPVVGQLLVAHAAKTFTLPQGLLGRAVQQGD